VINESEAKFHYAHATVLHEILAIKLLPIVNCEFSRNFESANGLLLEELANSGQCDSGDGPYLNPFGEVLNYHHGEFEAALNRGKWSNNVHAPTL
jgi:hypothetical protein